MKKVMCCFALAAALFVGQSTQASTVGLWLMDDLVDQTPSPDPENVPNPPGGEITTDSSSNNLHFVSAANNGTTALDADAPAAIGAPSSLLSDFGGAKQFSTPSSPLLHRGTTGSLTVEFWLKETRRTPSVAYLMSFNGGNGGGNTGDWGIYSQVGGNLQFFEYSNGFPEVGISAGSGVLNGAWHHVAFTMDAAGVMTSYLDGILQSQSAATGAAAPALPDVLKLARSPGDTFADLGFKIDELRISNVALLPGSGSGVGELAWSASLAPVPEPTALVMAIVAMMTVSGFSIRRR